MKIKKLKLKYILLDLIACFSGSILFVSSNFDDGKTKTICL